MSIEIKAGRRYVMRYGGITAPLQPDGSGVADGMFRWFSDGRYYSDRESGRDIIAEYTQPEPLGFDLKAGEKYETQLPSGEAGPVVELHGPLSSNGAWELVAPFSFEGADGWHWMVLPSGESIKVNEPQNKLRIVRPYIEPPKPTAIERLEKWKDSTCKAGAATVRELEAIIADLKAEARPA